MATYEVKKGLTGHKVLYSCPSCGVPLTSPLSKAGSIDTCPDCGQPHTIPGSQEKQLQDNSAAAIQRQKLEERLRRQAEETRKRNANAAKIPDEAPLTPTINNQSQDKLLKPKGRGISKNRFGDSILDVAFTFTRAFSIVVIVASLFALGGIFLMFVSSYNSYRSEVRTTTTLPSDADYKRFVELKSNDTPVGNEPQSATSVASKDPISAVLDKHKPTYNPQEHRYLRNLLDELEVKLRYAEFDECLRGLDKFLSGKKNKVEAANFFLLAYSHNYERSEVQIQDNELHNSL